MKNHKTLGYVCLFAVYVLWGCTFIGIRFAVETIPPLLAGVFRHGIGGLLLIFGLLLFKRWKKPNKWEFLNALFIGSITAGLSNGTLMWSEVNVPSAYAAIAFTTMPLFMLLFNYLAFEKIKPSVFDKIAIPLGIIGSCIVLISGENLHNTGIGAFDIFLLVLSPSSWAFGALLGRQIKMPKSILASSALQMIGGALFLIVLSFFHGEWTFNFNTISTKSIWGLLYLTLGGSFLGYTCFAIMMKNLEARIVGTYAFVNPVVALTFGYFFGEKIFELSIVTGACMSIAAVVMTFIGARHRKSISISKNSI